MPLDPSALDLIRDGGLVVGLLFFSWLLITDRLITPGRFKDMAERLKAVEKVRDEALAGWKAQADATKELAALVEKISKSS